MQQVHLGSVCLRLFKKKVILVKLNMRKLLGAWENLKLNMKGVLKKNLLWAYFDNLCGIDY